jgi:hypothetical protein
MSDPDIKDPDLRVSLEVDKRNGILVIINGQVREFGNAVGMSSSRATLLGS